jgi:hypothetical protein
MPITNVTIQKKCPIGIVPIDQRQNAQAAYYFPLLFFFKKKNVGTRQSHRGLLFLIFEKLKYYKYLLNSVQNKKANCGYMP